MGIRMSGIVSGLDTDMIIKELMSAQSMKKTKIQNKKTKLEWKQDKWKELNTKLYALYSKQLNNIKMQGTYRAKKVTSSNEDAVTATATSSAASGSHTLEINKLASSQYVTGDKIASNVKSSSKLTDIGMEQGTVIKVKAGNKTKTLTIEADTTVKDFVKTLTDAGLNASFDEKQHRFFISSKDSGANNAFSITASKLQDGDLKDASDALKAATGSTDTALNSFYESYNAAIADLNKKEAAKDNDTLSPDDKAKAQQEYEEALAKVTAMEDNLVAQTITPKATQEVVDKYAAEFKSDTTTDAYKELQTSVEHKYYKYDLDGTTKLGFSNSVLDKAETALKADIEKDLKENGSYATDADLKAAVETEYADRLAAAGGDREQLLDAKANELFSADVEKAIQAKAAQYAGTEAGKKEIQDIVNSEKDPTGPMGAPSTDIADTGAAVRAALQGYKTAFTAAGSSIEGSLDYAAGSAQLKSLGLTNITEDTISGLAGTGSGTIDGVSVTLASDAEIVLDGATLTGSSNTFTAAGLTMDLKDVTEGRKVTLNATVDTDGIYNNIKDFLKEYNSILEEMNKLYNAGSAKGYEPLTDEEKEAMSEDQIKLWEDKIKDSLLRRDGTLGSIADAMRSAMQTSVTVDGKSYSLASFGIVTSSDYTERGLLHLYGDADDSMYADKADKLKKALMDDPELVEKVLSGVMTKLSDTMMDKMKRTSMSSALTFYNDKEIKKNIDDYEKDIKKWEEKLKDMEDRYYKQFAAMESALSKINSQSSYLANLMGTSA